GINRNLNFATAGDNRFNVYITGSTESGSDVGSDLSFARYDDSGSFLATAMLIQRSSGNVGIGQSSPSSRLTIRPNVDSTDGGIRFE
ncbi:hypothetical protein, partial [Klebsiella pneumoniae]|uniref:hypothetical protein n=1 Tax=Klebsiella pneumoniae TaxID=573 RepID=UPI0039C10904